MSFKLWFGGRSLVLFASSIPSHGLLLVGMLLFKPKNQLFETLSGIEGKVGAQNRLKPTPE